MRELGLVLLLVAALACIAWGLRATRLRSIARSRLHAGQDELEGDAEAPDDLTPSLRRHPWVPYAIGAVVFAALWAFVMPWLYAAACGVIVGVLAHIVLGFVHQRNVARLETQLANAVDLMVASLGAGAGVVDAIDGAARESKKPLQDELQQVLSRIRYGETPQRVYEDFARRIPLETYRLFAFTLAVHGEVGGSLAPILAQVGRSIRDRIEIARRVRAASTQAQASVIGIIGITYFLAVLMWRSNPSGFEEFLRHPVGANFVAAALVLQAIGLLWIRRMAQMRF